MSDLGNLCCCSLKYPDHWKFCSRFCSFPSFLDPVALFNSLCILGDRMEMSLQLHRFQMQRDRKFWFEVQVAFLKSLFLLISLALATPWPKRRSWWGWVYASRRPRCHLSGQLRIFTPRDWAGAVDVTPEPAKLHLYLRPLASVSITASAPPRH